MSIGPTRAIGATLVLVPVIACSAERYARPGGPAPRYEAAPVAAWDAGAPTSGDSLATPSDNLDATGPHGDAGRIRGEAQRTGPHERVQEN